MRRSRQTISMILVISIAAFFIIQAQAQNARQPHHHSRKNKGHEPDKAPKVHRGHKGHKGGHKSEPDDDGPDAPCPAKGYCTTDNDATTSDDDEPKPVMVSSGLVTPAPPKPRNSTRRQLAKKYGGPCVAYNPIDRCWRCDPNWAKDRYRLAGCAMGFGRHTTGGKDGPIYKVTDSSDDNVEEPKPGTLRHAVIQKHPLWIIFAKSMTITLQQELLMQCDKTIDGRGKNVKISGGAGISIQFVRNIIIHNIHITDIHVTSGGSIRDSIDHIGLRAAADGDAISIFGSSDIWIDHVSASNAKDGLIDIVANSNGVTISNCHFVHHDKVLLFGAEDTNEKDKEMHVTVAYTHFGKNLIQRMPRVRWGFIHLVNNDYTHWLMYAIGGSHGARIISQGNRFIAPFDPVAKEVTHRTNGLEPGWETWNWRSEGDLMMNGAFFVESGCPDWRAGIDPLDLILPAPATEVTTLTLFTGPLGCRKKRPC
ncbi:probable pectate lyase P56 [Daucus carota subsp. sativus]|uniref:probable pectate lyase P56 n=1 Tax=Daucus carota subsp. sativus TaxID=79200 RepID=UPI0007B26376|nr:PREDICTED: probable pectate lyase P56 [Daucus carota subsp. sativus]